VETAEQAEDLYSLGCQEAQVFFFSHPEPIEALKSYKRPIAA
jgi:EAL domain-containing protein (putative c-di-GMP-specific phosphodiesterase class I)